MSDSDRTDFARIDAMTEVELEASIQDDPDWKDVPPDWYRGAEAVSLNNKVPISIRLDHDLVEFFRSQGRGWHTRINSVLRAYMVAVKKGRTGE